MHEKLLQGVTVGVVAGLLVYWFTSMHHADYAGQNTGADNYKPTYGDLRSIRNGRPSNVSDCAASGQLTTMGLGYTPLAADYLPCGDYGNCTEYAAPVSKWNLGISLQLTCEGIDLHSCIHRRETGTSFPHGVCGPNTIARPLRVSQQINCSPDVPLTVECTEVI